MRWEDERYVRFYTRDTPEFLALSWAARGLFGLVLRKVDRAGILPVGKLGAKGVAVAVGGPWVEIEPLLAELLADGCVVFDAARCAVFLPNFTAAQEAPQSDAARKRASREKARADLGGSASAAEGARAVTNRDAMTSQNVTESHTASHGVTPSHSVLIRSVPSRTDPDPPVVPPAGDPPKADEGEGQGQGKPKVSSKRRATMANRPATWVPNEGHFELGARESLRREDVLAEVPRWTDFHAGKGTTIADFDASFRTWLGNVRKFGGRSGGRLNGSSAKQRPAENAADAWVGDDPKDYFT